MAGDYKTYAADLDKRIAALFKAASKPMGGYNQLVKAAGADGENNVKIKELTALAISITSRCEDCIVYHCREAINHGASEAEVTETIGVAIVKWEAGRPLSTAHGLIKPIETLLPRLTFKLRTRCVCSQGLGEDAIDNVGRSISFRGRSCDHGTARLNRLEEGRSNP